MECFVHRTFYATKHNRSSTRVFRYLYSGTIDHQVVLAERYFSANTINTAAHIYYKRMKPSLYNISGVNFPNSKVLSRDNSEYRHNRVEETIFISLINIQYFWTNAYLISWIRKSHVTMPRLSKQRDIWKLFSNFPYSVGRVYGGHTLRTLFITSQVNY